MAIVTTECIDTGSRFGSLLWVEYRYTFANGYVHVIGPKKMPSMAEAQTECTALEATIPDQVAEQFYFAHAKQLVGVTTDPQLIIPPFPEDLPESDGDVSVSTRQREFHRWLLRWVFPQDIIEVSRHYGRLWQWIEFFSPPNVRTYLNLDTGTYSTVDQRMGTAVTIIDFLDNDSPEEVP